MHVCVINTQVKVLGKECQANVHANFTAVNELFPTAKYLHNSSEVLFKGNYGNHTLKVGELLAHIKKSRYWAQQLHWAGHAAQSRGAEDDKKIISPQCDHLGAATAVRVY